MDYQTRFKNEPPDIIDYMRQSIQDYFISPPIWGKNIFVNKNEIFERDEEAKTNYFITYVAVFIKKYVETEMDFIDELFVEQQKENPELIKADFIEQKNIKNLVRKKITECQFFHFVVTDNPFFLSENKDTKKGEN